MNQFNHLRLSVSPLSSSRDFESLWSIFLSVSHAEPSTLPLPHQYPNDNVDFQHDHQRAAATDHPPPTTRLPPPPLRSSPLLHHHHHAHTHHIHTTHKHHTPPPPHHHHHHHAQTGVRVSFCVTVRSSPGGRHVAAWRTRRRMAAQTPTPALMVET